jgi:hypothetical protein
MSVAQLALVKPPVEESADRVQRLYAEARSAAADHMTLLETVIRAEVRLAGEIARGGDPYPAGVRELCRRQADEAHTRLQSLQMLMGRELATLA